MTGEWLRKNLWKTGILVWFGFNVIFNFAPYLLVLPGGFLKGTIPSFSSYITGGELIIIAIAIAADSMGAIFLEYKKVSEQKSAWLVVSFIVLLLITIGASVSFIDIKSPTEDVTTLRIFVLSWVIFVSSFAISLAARSYLENTNV